MDKRNANISEVSAATGVKIENKLSGILQDDMKDISGFYNEYLKQRPSRFTYTKLFGFLYLGSSVVAFVLAIIILCL